jgi:hypothetical protein
MRIFFYRVHVACDTTFIYWEQGAFKLYLQDLFLTVRDPHRLHVRFDLFITEFF